MPTLGAFFHEQDISLTPTKFSDNTE